MSSKENLVPPSTEFDENTELVTEERNVVPPPTIETVHLSQRDKAEDNEVPLVPVGQQMDELVITGESTDELDFVVDNEGAVILQSVVVDVMNADEIPVPKELEVGHDTEHLSTEIAQTIKAIGDEVEKKSPHLRRLILATVFRENSIAIVKETAKKILNEAINWSTIALLLYFIYKVILKNLENIPYVNEVIKTIGSMFMAKINNWIRNNGGWRSILEYYHSIASASTTHTVACLGGAAAFCFVFGFALSYIYFKKN